MKRAGVTKITSSCQKGNLTKLNCYLVKSCTGVIRVVLKILFQMILPGQARNTMTMPLFWENNSFPKLTTSFRQDLKEAGHGQGHDSFMSYESILYSI